MKKRAAKRAVKLGSRKSYPEAERVKGGRLVEFLGEKIIVIDHLGRAFRYCVLGSMTRYVTLMDMHDHPLCRSKGHVAMHRYVLYEHLNHPETSECAICCYELPWTATDADRYPEANHNQLVINVDHIDGDTFNNSLSNLRPLCSWCNSNRGYEKFYPELYLELLSGDRKCHPAIRYPMWLALEEEGLTNPFKITDLN